MPEPITIVGGGIAGLALGIALRQRGVPVTLWEAGHYPRHRVCGEFISGRGQDVLLRLSLLETIETAGTRLARDAALFDMQAEVPPHPLPQPALCISRFALDHSLAKEFQRLGGILKTGERWHGPDEPGIVHASGRKVQPVVDGYRWIGLKAHARNITPSADMELHFLTSGYVGICRLPGNIVNVCGLFRSESTLPDLSKHWQEWLTGPTGSPLHARLSGAKFDQSTFCSVAGLDTRPHKAISLKECSIGDALTMTPPMTGNGMSMALESAEIASALLTEYSRGHLSWHEAQQQIASACDAAFNRRLHYANLLHRILFWPRTRASILRLIAKSPALLHPFFNLTR